MESSSSGANEMLTNYGSCVNSRHEEKEVLEELCKLVPSVNEDTPLLELLEKIMDYIAELQKLIKGSFEDPEDKENFPCRTLDLKNKMCSITRSCSCSSNSYNSD